jgi:dUTP pyrophosphatase
LIDLHYYKLYSDVVDPEFATSGSACIDIRAYLIDGEVIKTHSNTWAVTVKDGIINLTPGARALIPTGIVFNIPNSYSVRLHPRSGLAFKRGLTLSNCEGVIDSDYVEEVFVSIINSSLDEVQIEHGERIAQAEMIRSLFWSIKETRTRPERKSQRIGGFGSTGV